MARNLVTVSGGAAALWGRGEVSEKGLELSGSQAGETTEGIGGAEQGFVGKQLATSTLPDSIESS